MISDLFYIWKGLIQENPIAIKAVTTTGMFFDTTDSRTVKKPKVFKMVLNIHVIVYHIHLKSNSKAFIYKLLWNKVRSPNSCNFS